MGAQSTDLEVLARLGQIGLRQLRGGSPLDRNGILGVFDGGGLGKSMRIFRTLESEEVGQARRLLEIADLDDQFHHFQCNMSKADFDAWEEVARSHVIIGCFSGDELLGFAEIARDHERVECSLFIDARHRRKGIGTRLFERACLTARDAGAHSLSILVTRGDVEMFDLAARHAGYAVYQRTRSAILPGGEHAMACWLVFDLDSMAPAEFFADAVRWIRDLLEL